MSDEIQSTRMGQCSTCWNKGSPATLVTAPPNSRCVDMRACDARRAANVRGVRPVTKTATVETIRRRQVYYFRRVRKYIKDDKGADKLVREDLELVPTRERATKFEPAIANQIARAWNALAREL